MYNSISSEAAFESPVRGPLSEQMQNIIDRINLDYKQNLHLGTEHIIHPEATTGPMYSPNSASRAFGALFPESRTAPQIQTPIPATQNFQDMVKNLITPQTPQTPQQQQQQQVVSDAKRNRRPIGRGTGWQQQPIGGSRFQGANAIPAMQLPASVQIGTPSGPNPIVILLVLAGLGIGGYLLYHKLHKAKAEEHEMHKKGE